MSFYFHFIGALGQTRTGTPKRARILSPLCLPISPRGHSVLSLLYLSFINTQQPKRSLDFLVGNRWAIKAILILPVTNQSLLRNFVGSFGTFGPSDLRLFSDQHQDKYEYNHTNYWYKKILHILILHFFLFHISFK